ncbi:hypothetical protein IFM89_034782 [Coptis chinensis]|uniref:Uncharacterized protein n=1 Tax=Coptis chinensis TaxID=261450 RepID=A0A835HA88_9MAGN|nr:hypothetical protein IFM89_034782 [Coptis chinensis]
MNEAAEVEFEKKKDLHGITLRFRDMNDAEKMEDKEMMCAFLGIRLFPFPCLRSSSATILAFLDLLMAFLTPRPSISSCFFVFSAMVQPRGEIFLLLFESGLERLKPGSCGEEVPL